jgi:hypothetical protein
MALSDLTSPTAIKLGIEDCDASGENAVREFLRPERAKVNIPERYYAFDGLRHFHGVGQEESRL